uniref:Cyclic nucleotide-binding domain-containing protein n=1 Tax=Chromera velia CCMP2878 TaxID=1169474 RepID=A0A0G4FFN1_9ALVE|eukprot:Cvel_16739.t1-p1 / transcript=Cvel_16739.t1 / gene=Cvel_16739 / organism=Chromera_velia_CCMP2878 / gene_product=Potassium/sodium hyperpolarization-activated cyclic, putative / transcript_product=Potassium/sodium hyperpolarization-activated cyclic, putative / location=Cvel_scaffold1302:27903-39104(+) / protein_length=1372 / sequence_SO=supercontig / SO=protein_coding / is_pseudo=false
MIHSSFAYLDATRERVLSLGGRWLDGKGKFLENLIVHPHSNFQFWWDIAMTIFVVYSVWIDLIRISFQEPGFFIPAWFAIDLYLKGSFFVDTLSTLPLDQIVAGGACMEEGVPVVASSGLRETCSLKNLSSGAQGIIGVLGVRQSVPWTVNAGVENSPWDRQYLLSLYFVISTVGTIGYGDIHPTSSFDRLVTVFILLFCAAIFAYGITIVMALVLEVASSGGPFGRKLDALNVFMRDKGLPKNLRASVKHYLQYLKRYQLGKEDREDEEWLMAQLSTKLRNELLLHTNEGVLRKSPFFADCDPALLAELILNVRKQYFSPGETITMEKAIGYHMYILAGGSVSVSRDGKHIVNLSDGAVLGEMVVLGVCSRRVATVKALTFCDMRAIDRDTFQRIAANYPKDVDRMVAIAHQRLQETKQVDETAGQQDDEGEVSVSELRQPQWRRSMSSKVGGDFQNVSPSVRLAYASFSPYARQDTEEERSPTTGRRRSSLFGILPLPNGGKGTRGGGNCFQQAGPQPLVQAYADKEPGGEVKPGEKKQPRFLIPANTRVGGVKRGGTDGDGLEDASSLMVSQSVARRHQEDLDGASQSEGLHISQSDAELPHVHVAGGGQRQGPSLVFRPGLPSQESRGDGTRRTNDHEENRLVDRPPPLVLFPDEPTHEALIPDSAVSPHRPPDTAPAEPDDSSVALLESHIWSEEGDDASVPEEGSVRWLGLQDSSNKSGPLLFDENLTPEEVAERLHARSHQDESHLQTFQRALAPRQSEGTSPSSGYFRARRNSRNGSRDKEELRPPRAASAPPGRDMRRRLSRDEEGEVESQSEGCEEEETSHDVAASFKALRRHSYQEGDADSSGHLLRLHLLLPLLSVAQVLLLQKRVVVERFRRRIRDATRLQTPLPRVDKNARSQKAAVKKQEKAARKAAAAAAIAVAGKGDGSDGEMKEASRGVHWDAVDSTGEGGKGWGMTLNRNESPSVAAATLSLALERDLSADRGIEPSKVSGVTFLLPDSPLWQSDEAGRFRQTGSGSNLGVSVRDPTPKKKEFKRRPTGALGLLSSSAASSNLQRDPHAPAGAEGVVEFHLDTPARASSTPLQLFEVSEDSLSLATPEGMGPNGYNETRRLSQSLPNSPSELERPQRAVSMKDSFFQAETIRQSISEGNILRKHSLLRIVLDEEDQQEIDRRELRTQMALREGGFALSSSQANSQVGGGHKTPQSATTLLGGGRNPMSLERDQTDEKSPPFFLGPNQTGPVGQLLRPMRRLGTAREVTQLLRKSPRRSMSRLHDSGISLVANQTGKSSAHGGGQQHPLMVASRKTLIEEMARSSACVSEHDDHTLEQLIQDAAAARGSVFRKSHSGIPSNFKGMSGRSAGSSS